MNKQLLNEQIRFQAIAGLRPIGSLGTAYSLKEDDADSDYEDTLDSMGQPPISETSLASLFPGKDVGDMDNEFFMDLFEALGLYFMQNADQLSNMDAMGIAKHCTEAYKAVRGRSSN